MMLRAGRYIVTVFPRVQDGRATKLTQFHRNGSAEEVAWMDVDLEDLADLRYLLDRAIAAHRGDEEGLK
jgi:siroheme synthase (precorrin-2 oxidase/ferrochelatase)